MGDARPPSPGGARATSSWAPSGDSHVGRAVIDQDPSSHCAPDSTELGGPAARETGLGTTGPALTVDAPSSVAPLGDRVVEGLDEPLGELLGRFGNGGLNNVSCAAPRVTDVPDSRGRAHPIAQAPRVAPRAAASLPDRGRSAANFAVRSETSQQ